MKRPLILFTIVLLALISNKGWAKHHDRDPNDIIPYVGAKFINQGQKITCKNENVTITAMADKNPDPNGGLPPIKGDKDLPGFGSSNGGIDGKYSMADRKANVELIAEKDRVEIKLNFLDGSKKTNSLIYSDCMIYTSSGQFDSQGRMVRPGMAFVNEDIGTYDISCRKLESVSGRQVVNDRDKFINGLSFHGYAPDFEKKAFVSLNEKPVGAADISVSFSMIDSERQMTMYADFRIGYFGAGAALCDSGTR